MLTNEMTTNYYELTENNAHGEVLEQIAKDFQLFKHINIFKSINNIHMLEGYISHDVLTLRNRFKNELLEILKNDLNENEYNTIKSFI